MCVLCALCCVLSALCVVFCVVCCVFCVVSCMLCAVCSMLCALNCKNHTLRENWTESRQEGTCLNTAQQSVHLNDWTTVLVRLNPDFEVHANMLVYLLFHVHTLVRPELASAFCTLTTVLTTLWWQILYFLHCYFYLIILARSYFADCMLHQSQISTL